ncbi:zinc finger protein 518A [Denticeps clupeoides]|uniref:C2H2-type domain-containing protein n=1 Tax=Denticeps clupeoides TaxID=299321 RepID=A0AAY4AWS6_9TELE|nr:zinc finger protein 518A-like [Denticeps clupeoides]
MEADVVMQEDPPEGQERDEGEERSEDCTALSPKDVPSQPPEPPCAEQCGQKELLPEDTGPTDSKKARKASKKSPCKMQQGAVFSGKILSFCCSECKGNVTYSPNDLLKHFQRVHKGILPTYPCDLCSFVTHEFSALQCHRIGHRNTQVTCEICNDGVQYSLLLLTRHYIMCHSKNGHFHCDKCEFSTRDAGTFVQHIHHHNEGRHDIRHKCIKCKYVSATRGELQRHILVHSGTFPYTCHFCGYGAARKDYLTKHIAAVHGEENDRKNRWRLGDDKPLKASTPGLKLLLKKGPVAGGSREQQWMSKLHTYPGVSLLDQNGSLFNPEKTLEETQQFLERAVGVKKEGSKWTKGVAKSESQSGTYPSSPATPQPKPQESDLSLGSGLLNPNSSNGLTILMVKNKISIPPNCTTKVMGFKMVDGKKHLVLKVIPTKQEPSPQSDSIGNEMDSNYTETVERKHPNSTDEQENTVGSPCLQAYDVESEFDEELPATVENDDRPEESESHGKQDCTDVADESSVEKFSAVSDCHSAKDSMHQSKVNTSPLSEINATKCLSVINETQTTNPSLTEATHTNSEVEGSSLDSKPSDSQSMNDPNNDQLHKATVASISMDEPMGSDSPVDLNHRLDEDMLSNSRLGETAPLDSTEDKIRPSDSVLDDSTPSDFELNKTVSSEPILEECTTSDSLLDESITLTPASLPEFGGQELTLPDLVKVETDQFIDDAPLHTNAVVSGNSDPVSVPLSQESTAMDTTSLKEPSHNVLSSQILVTKTPDHPATETPEKPAGKHFAHSDLIANESTSGGDVHAQMCCSSLDEAENNTLDESQEAQLKKCHSFGDESLPCETFSEKKQPPPSANQVIPLDCNSNKNIPSPDTSGDDSSLVLNGSSCPDLASEMEQVLNRDSHSDCDDSTLHSPIHKVFSFHNYSKETSASSQSSLHDHSLEAKELEECEEESNEDIVPSEWSLNLASTPVKDEKEVPCRKAAISGNKPDLERVSDSDIEVDECIATVDEQPSTVLKDSTLETSAEEGARAVGERGLGIKSNVAVLGKILEKHSDAIISQQLEKERMVTSAVSQDAVRPTKTTLRILQTSEGKQQMFLHTSENKFAVPVQLSSGSGFKLITKSSPQINVSYMKPGIERQTKTTGLALTLNGGRIGMTGHASVGDKSPAQFSPVKLATSSSGGHYLVNTAALKRPVLLSRTVKSSAGEQAVTRSPTCYLVQRPVPIAPAPGNSDQTSAGTSAQSQLASRQVLAMPVSSIDGSNSLQTGRQAYLVRYLTPAKSGIICNNQEGNSVSSVLGGQQNECGKRVFLKIVRSPSGAKFLSTVPGSLDTRPIYLATGHLQSPCFLMSSNKSVVNVLGDSTTSDVQLGSTASVLPGFTSKMGKKSAVVLNQTRQLSQRKRRRKALFDEYSETSSKARRVSSKSATERAIPLVWEPASKEVERMLRLSPFSTRQHVKSPRQNQPVVVLNHPDADIPEVVSIMKSVNRFKGEVLKVALSQRTIKALSGMSHMGRGSVFTPHASVRERFILKLKLKKTSRNKYEVVRKTSTGSSAEQLSTFACWFCGRMFSNQEDWIGHGQRHLMEATRDWNKLF